MEQKNHTINEVISRVDNLDSKFSSLDTKVSSLDNKVTNLDNKFDKLSTKFDGLLNFLREHMVTRADLVLLEHRMDQKFAKQESLDSLVNSFDNFAKETLIERQENKIKNHRIEKMENWIQSAAKKIEIPYNS